MKLSQYKQSLQSNIWKYALFLVTNKRIYSPILAAYYLTIPKIDATQIGIILLLGSLAGFFLEIPSGYLSDKLGHKQTIVLSSIGVAISTLFFLFSNSLTTLILGGVFGSISYALFSGTGPAFMHETLRGLGRVKKYTSIMGKIQAIEFAVPTILMILVPFLIETSFKLPFAIGLVLDVIGIITVFSLQVPKVTQEHIDEVNTANFIDVLREAKKLKFMRIALYLGCMLGVAIMVTRFRAAYQFILEIPVIYYGLFIAISRGCISILMLYTDKLRKLASYNTYLAIRAVLLITIIAVLGFTTHTGIVVAMFISIDILLHGFRVLDNNHLLHIIKKSKFKATLLSLESQLTSLIIAIGSLVLGLSIDKIGYPYSFILVAAATVAILFPLYQYIIRNKSSKK